MDLVISKSKQRKFDGDLKIYFIKYIVSVKYLGVKI